MGKHPVDCSGHIDSNHQEIRFTLGGGGPGGMEVIIDSSREGVAIKIWHPFNHEWVTVDPAFLVYHGNTTLACSCEQFPDFPCKRHPKRG